MYVFKFSRQIFLIMTELWSFKPDTDFSTRLLPLRLFSIHLEQLIYQKDGGKIFLRNITTLISRPLSFASGYVLQLRRLQCSLPEALGELSVT